MDKETKTFLATIGIALAVLWVFKPKKSNESFSNADGVEIEKYHAPKVVAEDEKKLKDDAGISLQAIRDAINDDVSASEIDKLKDIILKENGIKIMIKKSTKKLIANCC